MSMIGNPTPDWRPRHRWPRTASSACGSARWPAGRWAVLFFYPKRPEARRNPHDTRMTKHLASVPLLSP